MKRTVLILTIAVMMIAQGWTQVAIEHVLGPRIGVSCTFMDSEVYSNQFYFDDGDVFFPVNTVFGLSVEQRIPLGETGSHFAIQQVLTIGGMEQSLFIPALSLLVGLRHKSGLEFGLGPIAVPGGLGVVVAGGYTIGFEGVYIPINISMVLPNNMIPSTVMLSTGFNFKVR